MKFKLHASAINFLQRVDINATVSSIHPMFLHTRDGDRHIHIPDLEREILNQDAPYPVSHRSKSATIRHIAAIQQSVVNASPVQFSSLTNTMIFHIILVKALWALFLQIFRIPLIIGSLYLAVKFFPTTSNTSILFDSIVSIVFILSALNLAHTLFFHCDHFSRWRFGKAHHDVDAGLHQTDDMASITRDVPQYHTTEEYGYNYQTDEPDNSNTKQHFNPPHILKINGDLETLLVGALYESVPTPMVEYVRRYVQNPLDDEWIAMDIAFPLNERGERFHNAHVPVCVVHHGLGGSSGSSYVRCIIDQYQGKLPDPAQRATCVAVNARSFNDTIVLSCNLYTGGRISDFYLGVIFAHLGCGNGSRDVIEKRMHFSHTQSFDEMNVIITTQSAENCTTNSIDEIKQNSEKEEEESVLDIAQFEHPTITNISDFYQHTQQYQQYTIFKQYATLFDAFHPNKLLNPLFHDGEDMLLMSIRYTRLKYTPVHAVGLSMSGVSLATMLTSMSDYSGLQSAVACCAISHMETYNRTISQRDWEGLLFWKFKTMMMFRFEYAASFNHTLYTPSGNDDDENPIGNLLTLTGYTHEMKKYLNYPPGWKYLSTLPNNDDVRQWYYPKITTTTRISDTLLFAIEEMGQQHINSQYTDEKVIILDGKTYENVDREEILHRLDPTLLSADVDENNNSRSNDDLSNNASTIIARATGSQKHHQTQPIASKLSPKQQKPRQKRNIHPIETIDKIATLHAQTMVDFDITCLSKISGYMTLSDFYVCSTYASKGKLSRLKTKFFIFHSQNDPCLTSSAQAHALDLIYRQKKNAKLVKYHKNHPHYHHHKEDDRVIKNISIFVPKYGGHLAMFPSLGDNFAYLSSMTSIFHNKVSHYYQQKLQQYELKKQQSHQHSL